MTKLIPVSLLILGLLYLLKRSSAKRQAHKQSRYDRKSASPWNQLNEEKDPTL